MLESHAHSQQKLNQHKVKVWLLQHKRLVLFVLLGGSCLIWQGYHSWFSQSKTQSESIPESSALLDLRTVTATARASQLKAMVKENKPVDKKQPTSIRDRYRARYLLGSDLVQQQQGKLALTYLQGLGKG